MAIWDRWRRRKDESPTVVTESDLLDESLFKIAETYDWRPEFVTDGEGFVHIVPTIRPTGEQIKILEELQRRQLIGFDGERYGAMHGELDRILTHDPAYQEAFERKMEEGINQIAALGWKKEGEVYKLVDIDRTEVDSKSEFEPFIQHLLIYTTTKGMIKAQMNEAEYWYEPTNPKVVAAIERFQISGHTAQLNAQRLPGKGELKHE